MGSQSSHPLDRAEAKSISFARIGAWYIGQQRYPEAVLSFKQSIRHYPSSNGFYNLGIAWHHLGDTQAAVDAYTHALDFSADSIATLNNLSIALSQAGKKRAAKNVLKKAIRLQTDYAESSYERSAALYNLGRIRRASKQFALAKASHPEFSAHYHFLEEALEAEGGTRSLPRFRIPRRKKMGRFLPLPVLAGKKQRQAYLGAGLLTAIALSPVVATLPQSALYESITSVLPFGQGTSLPQILPPGFSGAPSNSTYSSRSQRVQPTGANSAQANPLPQSSPTLPRHNTRSHSAQSSAQSKAAPKQNAARKSAPDTTRGRGTASSAAANSTASGFQIERRTSDGHNFRIGPFGFDASMSTSFEFNDNITSSNQSRESDFIYRLGFNLGSTWEVTRLNTLTFDIGASFEEYLSNNELDTTNNFLKLTPDTNLDFRTDFGDNFRLTLFETPSFDIDALDARVPTAGGGVDFEVSKFARLNNTAGFRLDWFGKRFAANAGFSRDDTIPMDDAFDFARTVQYNFPLGMQYKLAKDKKVGLNLGYNIRKNKKSTNGFKNNDANGYNITPFYAWEPSSLFDIRVSVGLDRQNFDNNGTSGDTENSTTATFDIRANHQLSKFYSHALSLQRRSLFGLTSNTQKLTTLAYTFDWKAMKDISVDGSFGYSRGSESGPLGEDFDRLSFRIGSGYKINKKLSFDASYGYLKKFSSNNAEDFGQNSVTFALNYDF